VKRIPVIGNGDVNSPQAARHMIDQTGCAGVMVGRAALVNPWFFTETRAFLDTGELPPPPTHEQRIAFMTEHFNRAVEFFGEHTACLAFRKVMGWYAETLKPGSEFMARMNKLSSALEFQALMNELAGRVEMGRIRE
jgi:tRNA-dihydrouridine synthase